MKDVQGNIDNAESGMAADSVCLTRADDKYTDSIELSNACREYYKSRKRAADTVKEKLATSGRQRSSKRNSLDLAMEKLRTEMASLMDQDLSLMEQLLNLNEAIEDLKWRKNYYHSQSSVPASSCNLSESEWSVSETDMYESDSETSSKIQSEAPLKCQIHSSHSVHSQLSMTKDLEDSRSCLKTKITSGFTPLSSCHMVTSSPVVSPCTKEATKDFDYFLTDTVGICRDDSSFDSGIHEPSSRRDIKV